MQRRLGRFLPIVMLAMLVQFLAPISASWAFGSALSDPLHLAGICSSATATVDNSGGVDHHAISTTCCKLCCIAQSATPPTDPQAAFVKLLREAEQVIWHDCRLAPSDTIVNSQAQARAPPAIS